ncbi:predicted protein [Naegleria gruberi]|uniref:Predicted protein n=1 Tax=Naegleria gruberi TaxID=5762 RepID=D2VUI7_NAEGR|nr:uncharacterized protein NAEGRDRAFT_72676 [Naegleria gruberi]EFC39455.1 predicted protein [Naegleria gruberi]|eukprot:XP_002672199.1 predicted protein [Naegleria gruberi strain NEG-M]
MLTSSSNNNNTTSSTNGSTNNNSSSSITSSASTSISNTTTTSSIITSNNNNNNGSTTTGGNNVGSSSLGTLNSSSNNANNNNNNGGSLLTTPTIATPGMNNNLMLNSGGVSLLSMAQSPPSNNSILNSGLHSSSLYGIQKNATENVPTNSTVTTRDENSVYGNYSKIVEKSETFRTVTYANVSRLATDFGFLIDNEELSDVQLRIGSGKNQRTFHCHKVILCQRSEYFRNMFLVSRGMFLESGTPLSTGTSLPFSGNSEVLTNSFGTRISIVEKPNITPIVFEKVLQYIYTGRVTFTTQLKHKKIKDKTVHVTHMISTDDIDNVISMCMHVLAAADELILLELKNFCVDYVKQYIDSESAIVLLDLASKYGSEDLIENCFDFIKHNAREVIASESLPFVSKLTMKTFLESEYLAVDEIELFRALLRWGLSQIEHCQDEDAVETYIANADDEELSDEEEEIALGSNGLSPEDISHIKEILSQPPEEEELIFRKKHIAMFRKKQLLNDYESPNDGDDTETIPFAVVKNPLRDDISLHTRLSLDPVPQNRHHTDLIQLANRLRDEDKQLLRDACMDLISCIRFPLMTAHQLTDVVEIFNIVEDSLLLEAYRHVCAPDRTPLVNCKRAQKRKGATEGENTHFGISTILKSKNRQELIKMAGETSITKGKIWTLAFKATKDGFDSNVFHKMCDQKGPSILVCRTTEGYIFGGYNSVEWNSSNQWLKANDTFLFSLINPYNDGPRKLKVKNTQRAVYCHASSGPSFGGGTNLVFDPYDLYLDSTLKRGHTNVGGAYSTFRGGFRSDEAQKSLAGSLNAWILNEVEVYLLQ